MSGDEEEVEGLDDGAGFLKDGEGKRIPRADMTAEQKHEDNRRRKLREKRKRNPDATMDDAEAELAVRTEMTEEELEILEGLKGKSRSDMTDEERQLQNRQIKLRKFGTGKKPEELTEEEILVVEGCKDTPRDELCDEEKQLLDRWNQLQRAKAKKSGDRGAEMCGDWKRGDCSRGDSCRYSHGPDSKAGTGKGRGKSEFLTIEQAQMFAEMMFWQGAEAARAKNAGNKGKGKGKGKSYGKDPWSAGGKGKGGYGKDSWGNEGKGYGKAQNMGNFGQDPGKGDFGMEFGMNAFEEAWNAETSLSAQDAWVAGEDTSSVLTGGRGSIRDRLQQLKAQQPAPEVQKSRLGALFQNRGVQGGIQGLF